MTDTQQDQGPLGTAAAEWPPSARETVNRMIEAGLFDDLMSQVDDGGLALTGQGGLLPELVKAVLERGLQAEMTGHLG
jgi:putative transposase